MHEDFMGNFLGEGDEVAYIAPLYHHLKRGVIVKFTPKKVRMMNDDCVFPEDIMLMRKRPEDY